MMQKKLLLLLVLLNGIFSSCQWDKGQQSIGTKEKIDKKISTVTYYQVFFDEIVKSETFILDIHEEAQLRIEVEGEETTLLFSDIFDEMGHSTWLEEMYFNGVLVKRFKDEGVCFANYRKLEGRRIVPIKFSKNPEDYQLKFKIGEKLYPLGVLIDYEDYKVTLDFFITKEMLEVGDTLSLSIQIKERSFVRIGFLEYFDCEGLGKKDFESNLYTYESKISDKHLKYKINLFIKEEQK